ncbi:MAG: sulfate adenylyltransferase subunit CysN [Acidobacteria bacterium]|nr:MAG: sulfate adenylyltransferase subunit CysN [Acidobacteriota bacterium]
MISSAKNAPADAFAAFLDQDLSTKLLRFTTAGSVDDGKSTLIGRLLHDSKAVYEDQLASVKRSRINRSTGPIDFSLITDGLRAEREQGITIDVAYRYFATSRRKFIIADTPGHEQYTRNMATGASTADLAVILIDATKGLLAQTRRHAFIASVLGIKHVLAAVNKMDLAEYREDLFLKLKDDFVTLAAQLGITNVQCIPISALEGDNIVERSARMRWYDGPTLLEHLETVPLPDSDSLEGFRFPIQSVIRPDANFRGFAGRIASGVVRPGDSVVALPSGQKTRVHSIVTYDGDLPRASSPMSVTLQLEAEIDLSRGDMLVSSLDVPRVARNFHATVVWLHANPLELGRTYLVKHTVRQTKIRATRIRHRVNINTLMQEQATQLRMNEIGSVEFEANVPLFFDPYASNRTTGSFILIDALSNATVGAGMIQEDPAAKRGSAPAEAAANLRIPAGSPVSAQERRIRRGHWPAVLLLEGRQALATRLERHLFEQGFEVLHLTDSAVSTVALSETIRVTQAAGIVVLYSGSDLDAETKRLIATNSEGRFFDLAESKTSHLSEEEHAGQALAFAQALRLPRAEKNQEKVN